MCVHATSESKSCTRFDQHQRMILSMAMASDEGMNLRQDHHFFFLSFFLAGHSRQTGRQPCAAFSWERKPTNPIKATMRHGRAHKAQEASLWWTVMSCCSEKQWPLLNNKCLCAPVIPTNSSLSTSSAFFLQRSPEDCFPMTGH